MKYKVTLEVSKIFDGSITLSQIEYEMKKIGWRIEKFNFKRVD